MSVQFRDCTFAYTDADRSVLRKLAFEIPDGTFTVVIGPTGSGKSTLLGLINGITPHITGGSLSGDVVTYGRSIRTHQPHEFAGLVGVVPQDPATAFVTDVVEDELAYTLECLGTDPQTMRKRIEETLDAMRLHDIRGRALQTLSGGQVQRVAIASVLVAHPRILVLDEPTSALDPAAADDVLAALHRLVHDLGLTVVMSEHRLERVLQYADAAIALDGKGNAQLSDVRSAMESGLSMPPIVELARHLKWPSPPLTIREARIAATSVREALAATAPPIRTAPPESVTRLSVDRLTVRFGSTEALRQVTASVKAGEICALMGRNGAGKSTLLRAFAGLVPPSTGTVSVAGRAPNEIPSRELPRRIGVVPQQPADLLLGAHVGRECADADIDADLSPGTTLAVLASLDPDIDIATHPRDLSEGQRLRLALAIVLAPQPDVLLLDEPTRGLDYPGKARLATILRSAAAQGTAVIVATHDVEFAAECAHTVLVLADGEVIAHDVAAQALTTSPLFAPQIAKVMAPHPWLTVEDVVAACDVS